MFNFTFDIAVFAARACSSVRQISLDEGHAQEVMASLFGYDTYQALTTDLDDAVSGTGLEVAEHYIVNPASGVRRCRQLGLAEGVAECCLTGAKEAFKPRLFTSVEEFWQRVARRDVSSRIRDMNGFELHEQSENFWQARDKLVLITSGDVKAPLGLEDSVCDGPSADEANKVFTSVVYRKAGGAGVIFSRIDQCPQISAC